MSNATANPPNELFKVSDTLLGIAGLLIRVKQGGRIFKQLSASTVRVDFR